MGPPPPIPPYLHETEFSVITVGSGSPELNPSRASACTVVQYRGKYYVVDAGNGSALSFVKGGRHGSYRHRDIAAVLLTHLHQDHVNDYFDLVTARWGEGGKRLDLIGPPGTGELHRFLITFFRDDLVYRWLGGPAGIDDEGMFKGVEVRELTGSNEFDLDGVRVTTAEITHSMYDLGYRFEAERESVVVSGDTAFDPRLDRAFRRCRRPGHRRQPLGRWEEAAPASQALPNCRRSIRYGCPIAAIPMRRTTCPCPTWCGWRPRRSEHRGVHPSVAAARGSGLGRADVGGVPRRRFQGRVVFAEDGLEVAV